MKVTKGWTLHLDGDPPCDYGTTVKGIRRCINDAIWNTKVRGRRVTIRRPSGALYASDLAGDLVKFDGVVISLRA